MGNSSLPIHIHRYMLLLKVKFILSNIVTLLSLFLMNKIVCILKLQKKALHFLDSCTFSPLMESNYSTYFTLKKYDLLWKKVYGVFVFKKHQSNTLWTILGWLLEIFGNVNSFDLHFTPNHCKVGVAVKNRNLL